MNRIFFYGTLLPDHLPAQLRDLEPHMRALGAATIPGCLYDLGAYPGAVLSEAESHGKIFGQVFELPDDPAEVLDRLDVYEGCNVHHPQRGLFRRVKCHARLAHGAGLVECWVYAYNRPVDPAYQIPSGRWKRKQI